MPDAEYSFSWNVFPPCVRSVSIQLPQSGDSLRRRHRARCPCVEPPRSGFGECAQAVEVREACSCPRGIATTIQNGVHADQFSINRVIHSERKPFRQTASISENNCMQTGMNEKRVDIRKERIREIRARVRRPALHRSDNPRSSPLRLHRGSRSSPKLLANLVLGFLPILELGGAIGNSLLTLIKNVFMP